MIHSEIVFFFQNAVALMAFSEREHIAGLWHRYGAYRTHYQKQGLPETNWQEIENQQNGSCLLQHSV